MFIKSTLLASIAAIFLIGSANAGVIDITGKETDGTPNVFSHYEAGSGSLTAIIFDLRFEAYDPSWASEVLIKLEHLPTNTVFIAGGGKGTIDLDFDWESHAGIYSTSSSLEASLPDKSGLWEVTLSEHYDDLGISPDGKYLETSTITLATEVPEPGTLALFGLGLAGLGFARRRRAA